MNEIRVTADTHYAFEARFVWRPPRSRPSKRDRLRRMHHLYYRRRVRHGRGR